MDDLTKAHGRHEHDFYSSCRCYSSVILLNSDCVAQPLEHPAWLEGGLEPFIQPTGSIESAVHAQGEQREDTVQSKDGSVLSSMSSVQQHLGHPPGPGATSIPRARATQPIPQKAVSAVMRKESSMHYSLTGSVLSSKPDENTLLPSCDSSMPSSLLSCSSSCRGVSLSQVKRPVVIVRDARYLSYCTEDNDGSEELLAGRTQPMDRPLIPKRV